MQCNHQHTVTDSAMAIPSTPKKKYFCPMCDGVESDKPGSCPKCGMALERNPTFREPAKTIYTCPMHPQIEQDHPGNCPICGMTLEPKNVGAGGEEENAELHDMTRRFWIGLALALPVFLLAMALLTWPLNSGRADDVRTDRNGDRQGDPRPRWRGCKNVSAGSDALYEAMARLSEKTVKDIGAITKELVDEIDVQKVMTPLEAPISRIAVGRTLVTQ